MKKPGYELQTSSRVFFFFLVTVYFRVQAGNSRENLVSCQHRTKMPSEETKVSFIEFNGADMALNYLLGTHQ